MSDTSVVRPLLDLDGWDVILHTEWARKRAKELGYPVVSELDNTYRVLCARKETAVQIAEWIGEYEVEDDCGK